MPYWQFDAISKNLGNYFDNVKLNSCSINSTHFVTASKAKQSPGLQGDCFVPKGDAIAKDAPRNDSCTKS